jgi:hypothetical protein
LKINCNIFNSHKKNPKGNDWQQVFIVIFGSEQGGKMTGVQTGKISDTIITLTTPLTYLSNKIRLSVGDT